LKNRGPGMGKKAVTAAQRSGPRRKAAPKKSASSTRGRRQPNPISSFVNRLALEELEQLVETATARRDELRRSARAAFLHEVKARAANLGVSLAELTGSRSQKTAAAEQSKGAGVRQRAKPKIKFRNPQTGETWTGMGCTARWDGRVGGQGAPPGGIRRLRRRLTFEVPGSEPPETVIEAAHRPACHGGADSGV
jgi:DNA-binding protein H-NS